ncbi:ribosome biogenesis protein Nop16 [Coniella lustricola]|uniref:Nucleolar protein 16 n=1 Tax=Coniella lustricola TaxID=2025994 RepID=A0A2T2ZWG5_9PEZI|nr:ribosome biogenesis protein Nop16 [Coniella lustricola]
MGRDLQKRKRRSSRPTIRQSNQPKKPLNPRGNSIVAKNWNKNETLSQNYRRLGLTAKLGKATGGTEQLGSSTTSPSTATSQNPSTKRHQLQDPLAVTPADGMRGAIRTVKVQRDADGKIVRVLHRANPLDDPLNELESDSDLDQDDEDADADASENTKRAAGHPPRVVDLLEEQANMPTEKHIRHQSAGEREWIERLIAKHGDDTAAMARDMRLNPMQQTGAEIRRKIKTYQGA